MRFSSGFLLLNSHSSVCTGLTLISGKSVPLIAEIVFLSRKRVSLENKVSNVRARICSEEMHSVGG